jgi:hypothetical protein
MKTRTSIVGVATVGLLGAGACFLPAGASPHSSTHTLKFTSLQQKSLGFSRTHFAQLDMDVNSAHNKVGFDTLQGVFNPKTGAVKIDLAVNTKGGFMYFHLHSTTPNADSFAGRLTGGTGQFKHAHGSMEATNLNKSGSRTAVTITYKN